MFSERIAGETVSLPCKFLILVYHKLPEIKGRTIEMKTFQVRVNEMENGSSKCSNKMKYQSEAKQL